MPTEVQVAEIGPVGLPEVLEADKLVVDEVEFLE